MTLGVPHQGQNYFAWTMAFKQLLLPPNTKIISLSGQPVDQARNMIVEQSEGEWLFFLDSDVICPPDTIPRLINTAVKNDFKIVSGLYWRRDTNPVPGAYHYFPDQITQFGRGGHRAILNWKPGEIFQADAVGAGCLLVKREVFRIMPPSCARDFYIKHYGDTPASRNIPDGWFYFGTIKMNQMSEDFCWTNAARLDYGINTYVDSTVLCRHILPFSIGAEGFQAVDAG